MGNSLPGADGFQNYPLHKTPEQQSTATAPRGNFPARFPRSSTFPRDFGQGSRHAGLGGFAAQTLSHCHTLLPQEITETFPGEDGCDEQSDFCFTSSGRAPGDETRSSETEGWKNSTPPGQNT